MHSAAHGCRYTSRRAGSGILQEAQPEKQTHHRLQSSNRYKGKGRPTFMPLEMPPEMPQAMPMRTRKPLSSTFAESSCIMRTLSDASRSQTLVKTVRDGGLPGTCARDTHHKHA